MEKANQHKEKAKEELNRFYETLQPSTVDELNSSMKATKASRIKHINDLRLRRKRDEHQRPKKNPGAFFLYTKTLDRGDASMTDFNSGASRKWQALPEEEKQVGHKIFMLCHLHLICYVILNLFI